MIRFIDEPGIIAPIVGDMGIKTAVTTFSRHLFGELISKTGAKKIFALPGGVEIDVYEFVHDGKRLAAYMSPVGAPAAVAAMEEMYARGVENIVAFGICGALIDIPTRKLVVPTRAFRDEGTSYHYAAASDYIDLTGSKAVAEYLSSCGLSFVEGATWTTDGFYRETRTRVNEMKANGCIAVDMECSALQAAACYRGKDFYTFFITADSLSGEEWEPNYLLDVKATSAETVAVAAAVGFAAGL